MNGDLYAGGWFTSAGGNPANQIAKWNGSNWSALGGGTNNNVRAIASYNGEVYAGGFFTTADGNPANYIAKWQNVIDIESIISDKSSVTVYPNPSSGAFTAYGFQFPVQIHIYNSSGQIIHEQTLNRKEEIISLSNAGSGNYIVQIITQKNMHYKKVILK